MDNQDIPSEFAEVVEKHGRERFMLVWNSGMVAEALVRLAAGAPQGLAHAVGVVAAGWNQVAQALVVSEGWTQEELAETERDIQLAWAGRVRVAETKILLN